MDQIGFVYIWINKANGKKYVGAHAGTEDDGYIGSGTVFKKAIAKYGVCGFDRKILYREYESLQNLFRRESEIINELNAVFSSEYYNLTNYDPKFVDCASGNKHRIMTEETKEKMRRAKLGTKASDSTRLKMSETRRGRTSPTKGMTGLTSGEKNGNWGKVCCNNGARNGYFVLGQQPEGWVPGILRKDSSGVNNPFFGKKHTKETIDRLREQKVGVNSGRDNPFFGKRHTDESLGKMRKPRRRPDEISA
jgi:group I intron endonuclease